jgi:hypothetical protein
MYNLDFKFILFSKYYNRTLMKHTHIFFLLAFVIMLIYVYFQSSKSPIIEQTGGLGELLINDIMDASKILKKF